MTAVVANTAATAFHFARHRISPRDAVPDAQERHLSAHAAMRVERALGRTVACLAGTLWITHDGDCRDVILTAGCRHRCDRNTRLIVQALADGARVRIL
jgi:hypothetical protein